MNSQQRLDAADRQRRGRPAPPAIGLSTLHSSPPASSAGAADYDEYRDGDGAIRWPSLETAPGGEFAQVHIPLPLGLGSRGGPRGSVKTFSRASRRRLQKTLAGIDRRQMPNLPLFVTLTYPLEWPSTATTWKQQLDTFLKRLDRRFPQSSAIWKLEFQKRGAPHFHLMIFGVKYISQHWIARAWNDIVAPGDEKHLAAGTEVRRVRSWRGVASYAAKYMSKAEKITGHGEVGRYWGVFNRKNLPIQWIKIKLTWRQAFTIRRTFYRALDKKGAGPKRRNATHGQSMFIAWDILTKLIENLDPPRGIKPRLP